MRFFIQVPVAILIFLECCYCFLVLPGRFHSLSELRIQSKKSLFTDPFDIFLVNEYVDLPNDRSSLRLDNLNSGVPTIFYHRHTGIDQKSTLTEYNINGNVCKSTLIHDWPLASIRGFVTRMLPLAKLVKEVSDIALGPSALLIAVEESLDDFNYVDTVFSAKRLVNLDIYSYITDAKYFKESDSVLLVKVMIPNTKKDKKKAQNLAELARTDYKTEIFAIDICEVSRDKMIKQRKLNKDYLCDKEELKVHVNYFILSELTPNTLVGESLEDQQEFEFGQNPFSKPIGIGCWQNDLTLEGLKRFNAPNLQFSAEYLTTNGLANGLSYVAFDGYRQILRLDRQGRKSIYDLDEEHSYHIGEFKAINEISNRVERAKDCIVLETGNSGLYKGSLMLERLLGIGTADGGATAHYLGSKVIDHISYEVYESELLFNRPLGLNGYNLPILMESSRFKMPLKEQSRSTGSKYFMTYYVTEVASKIQDLRGRSDSTDVVSVPKFIELWKFSKKSNKKVLINRLEFAEFNWALDVEPSGDPDSQDLSRVFNMETCARERAYQTQFRFRIIQEPKGVVQGTELIESFKEHTQIIKEIVQEKLSSVLDVPRVNIAKVDLSFIRQSPNILVESRLVELNSGLSVDTLIGYTGFLNIIQALKDHLIMVFQNRHSLEACRLDSLSRNEKNIMMFCKGLTLCLLFKDDAMNDYHVLDQTEKVDKANSLNPTETMCEVHRFIWALKPVTHNNYAVLSRAADNIYKIAKSTFEIPFIHPQIRDDKTKLSGETGKLVKDTYRGLGYAPEMKTLDTVGFAGFEPPFVGMRYTTMLEEPKALDNYNYGIKMSMLNAKEDRFEFCHRACTLSNYCESYSVCLRKSSSKVYRNDCVLSTLRLTHSAVEEIAESLKNTEGDVVLTDTSHDKSQVFRFVQDPECSIYPKDVTSLYKMLGYFNVKASEEEHGRIKGQSMSLDDCFSQAYNDSLWLNTMESDFVYCPLDSLCFIGAKSMKEIATVDYSQLCYAYSRSHLQFFNQYMMARLVVRLETQNEKAQKDTTSASPSGLAGAIADVKKFEELKIGRVLEGLEIEQCARDCSLFESKCLAFDYCQTSSTTTLCILYSIRSPMSGIKKKYGFLEQEMRFYASENKNASTNSNTINIIGDTNCNHHVLKGVYFDIRLQQMLEKDSVNSRDKLGEMEKQIIGLDEKQSDRFFEDLENKSNSNSNKVSQVKQKDGGGINLITLLIGSILGVTGVLYGKETTEYAIGMVKSRLPSLPAFPFFRRLNCMR